MQICMCICIPLDTGKQFVLVEYEDSRCVATPGCPDRESFAPKFLKFSRSSVQKNII